MVLQDVVSSLDTAGTVVVPPGWTQGRALFGGLVAAFMAEALIRVVGEGVPLRSLTVSFVAPAASGALTCRPEILRRGRSVVQGLCRAEQDGQVVAVLMASFGAGRESTIVLDECPPPRFGLPEAGQALPYIPGVVPEFTQHYDFRWSLGSLPFMGHDRGDIGGWVREREGRGALDLPALLGLIDAWPPAVLPMFKAPAPISSLTWTVEFMPGATDGDRHDWWQYLAETEFAAEGYVHTRARLWSAAGRLVALSRQTVTVFA